MNELKTKQLKSKNLILVMGCLYSLFRKSGPSVQEICVLNGFLRLV